jgi:hypothetical protein
MNTAFSIFLCLSISSLLLLSGCGDDGTSSVSAINPASDPSLSDSGESTLKKVYSINLDTNGNALRGYDAVEYFRDQKSMKGSPNHVHHWKDAKWQFASEENKVAFAADPGKYAPSNGGYCTFGVALGKKFDGDPEIWKIEQDQLYIFLNNEVREKFYLDLNNNLKKVNENWQSIRDKPPDEL